jgi:creatinine amidohydrolase
MTTLYRLEELFPEQLQQRIAETPILVLPFGTIEWHSHHLPLGLDGIVAQALGERIASACGGVLAPVSYWGVGGVCYPFTLNFSASIIEPLLHAGFQQFAGMGFRVLVGFTGHFGLDQTVTLKRAALAAMQSSPAFVLPLTEYDLTTDAGYLGDHAGIGETSLLWAVRPDLVRLDAVPTEQSLDGVLGEDPRGKANPEFGEKLLSLISSRAAEVAVRFLRSTSSAERGEFIAATEAGLQVLDRTAQQRRVLPKNQVPPIVTPAYRAFCQALYRGDYRAAQEHAARKLADLSL